MTLAEEKLEAKVKAVNRAHKYAKELYAKLAPIFAPLVGEKVLKADDQLMVKYRELLPELPNTVPLFVYRDTSRYSLSWTVRTCENLSSGRTCDYYEVTVYVCDLDDGVVSKLYKPPTDFQNLRDDYDIKDILTLRAKVKEAKDKYTGLKSQLGPFEEA